jgi:uncharacterized damage-inducible protein DinB
MNAESLLSLYTYNAYANELLFQVIQELSDEQLDAQSSPSRGTVRTLLIHMLAAENYFLSACTGRQFGFDPKNRSTPPSIMQHWLELAEEQQIYLNSVSEGDLAEIIAIAFGKHTLHLPRWQLLTQAVVHSIHHRGELSIVLSQMGHPLPTLDPILHFVHQSGQDWPME